MSDKTVEPRVAVVDDDESLLRSMARLFRAVGLQAATYRSAEEFLQDDRCPRFDCLIVDIQLGGMSGIELCSYLARTGSATPVVFLTAHDDRESRERGASAGCAAFLSKREPAEVVLEQVYRAIDPLGRGQ